MSVLVIDHPNKSHTVTLTQYTLTHLHKLFFYYTYDEKIDLLKYVLNNSK